MTEKKKGATMRPPEALAKAFIIAKKKKSSTPQQTEAPDERP